MWNISRFLVTLVVHGNTMQALLIEAGGWSHVCSDSCVWCKCVHLKYVFFFMDYKHGYLKLFGTTLLFYGPLFPLFNHHLSTATFPWCRLLPSDMGGLSWWERCWRSVWWSAEKSGVGDGPREPHCGKGAAGPFRQHPDALLCWGSLRPEWLCTAWWQDRHLESWVEKTDREKQVKKRGACAAERRRKKALIFLGIWQKDHVIGRWEWSKGGDRWTKWWWVKMNRGKFFSFTWWSIFL